MYSNVDLQGSTTNERSPVHSVEKLRAHRGAFGTSKLWDRIRPGEAPSTKVLDLCWFFPGPMVDTQAGHTSRWILDEPQACIHRLERNCVE